MRERSHEKSSFFLLFEEFPTWGTRSCHVFLQTIQAANPPMVMGVARFRGQEAFVREYELRLSAALGELDSDERVAGVAAGRRRCPPPGEDQFLRRADLTISSLDHVVLVAKLHLEAIGAADAQLELGDPRLEFRAWRHPLRERLRIG